MLQNKESASAVNQLEGARKTVARHSGFVQAAPFICKVIQHWRPQLSTSSFFEALSNPQSAQAKGILNLLDAAQAVTALRLARQDLLLDNQDALLKEGIKLEKGLLRARKLAHHKADIDEQIRLEQQEDEALENRMAAQSEKEMYEHLDSSAHELDYAMNELERLINSLQYANDDFDKTFARAQKTEKRLDRVYELRLRNVQAILDNHPTNKLALNHVDNDFLKNRMSVREYHKHNKVSPQMHRRAEKVYDQLLQLQPNPHQDKNQKEFYGMQMHRLSLVLASKGLDAQDVKKLHASAQPQFNIASKSASTEYNLRQKLEKEVDNLLTAKKGLDQQQERTRSQLRLVDEKAIAFKPRQDDQKGPAPVSAPRQPELQPPQDHDNPEQSKRGPQPAPGNKPPEARANQNSPQQQLQGVTRDQTIYQYLRLASYLLIPVLDTRRGQTAESFSARQNKVEDIIATQNKDATPGKGFSSTPKLLPPGSNK